MVELLAMAGAAALGCGAVKTWRRFVAVNKCLVYAVEAAQAEFQAARHLGCDRCRTLQLNTGGRVLLCCEHGRAARD